MADYIPPEIAAEQRKLERRRKMAELLMGQQDPMQGQMVSGHYVAPSPLQGIANMASSYLGAREGRKLDQSEADLEARQQQILADAVRNRTTQYQAAPTPQDRQRIVEEAYMSQNPAEQRWAEMQSGILGREDEQAAAAELNAQKSAAEEAQKREALQQRSDDLAANRENLRTIAEINAAGRPPRIETVVIDGKPVKINAVTKEVLGDAPLPGKGGALSATSQKELFEAEDMIASGNNAISILESIVTPSATGGKSQNDLARGGAFGEFITDVAQYIPGSTDKTDQAVSMRNKVTGQALENLKAIFGGMPTEGERKVLLEMQGSLNMTPEQRKEIFDRAIALAKVRVKFNQDKAAKLRGGTYFDEQMNPVADPPAPPAGANNAAQELNFDAQGNLIP